MEGDFTYEVAFNNFFPHTFKSKRNFWPVDLLQAMSLSVKVSAANLFENSCIFSEDQKCQEIYTNIYCHTFYILGYTWPLYIIANFTKLNIDSNPRIGELVIVIISAFPATHRYPPT